MKFYNILFFNFLLKNGITPRRMEPVQFKDTKEPLIYPNYDYPDFEPIFYPETATSDTETDDDLKGDPDDINWKTQIYTNSKLNPKNDPDYDYYAIGDRL